MSLTLFYKKVFVESQKSKEVFIYNSGEFNEIMMKTGLELRFKKDFDNEVTILIRNFLSFYLWVKS